MNNKLLVCLKDNSSISRLNHRQGKLINYHLTRAVDSQTCVFIFSKLTLKIKQFNIQIQNWLSKLIDFQDKNFKG